MGKKTYRRKRFMKNFWIILIIATLYSKSQGWGVVWEGWKGWGVAWDGLGVDGGHLICYPPTCP